VSAPAPSSERGPVYRAPDGSFALFNDYGAGRAMVVAAPPAPEPGTAFEVWDRRRADGPRALAPAQAIDGYGVFTFPYGPVSMGVPEAGRFDLRTYGERLLDIVPVGGFKSRRILASLPGLTIADAGLRIERLAGPVSASHVSAFLLAAESAAGATVPAPELWVRAVAQELQRLYNHLRVIARVAEAAAQNVGVAQTQALAEEILQLEGRVFGHRWLFGALLPGGPPRRLESADRRAIAEELDRRSREFEGIWELFLESRTFVDRIQTTCPVSRELAVRWGAVGPALRATGVPWDDRLRIPVAPYHDMFLALPKETEGDALARVVVRAEEIRASFLLLEQLLGRWPAASGAGEPALPPIAPGRGLGRAEGPSGDVVYDVRLDGDRIAGVGMRSPSDANWPVFALGLREGVFTDFHFACESFGFLFAESDA